MSINLYTETVYNNYEVINLKTRIKKLRDMNNHTKKEVADSICRSVQTYAGYERGTHRIPLNVIVELAKFYGTSTDYILKLTNEIKPYPYINKIIN